MSTLLGLILVISCETKGFEDYPTGKITLPNQKMIHVVIADTYERQKKGLSGVQSADWPKNWGMLFPAKNSGLRQFWMPHTFFNLDIIFLTKDFFVIDIHRNLQHSPVESLPKHKVPWSKKVYSQHVLELRSDSKFAKEIQVGAKLNWSSDPALSQITPDIRHER